jgi:hypothetical protein
VKMVGTYLLLPALLALLFLLLVVRTGAIALRLTGVERERARFQALSAFTGTGFTTREAESMMNHPTRRRVISWLIIVGNAGFIAVIVTSTSSLAMSRGFQLPLNGLVLLAGAIGVYTLATRRGLLRRWDSFIEARLMKSSVFEEAPTEDLLHLLEGYGLVRTTVFAGSSLARGTLAGLRLSEKGVLVLGIERGGHYMPIPRAEEPLAEGDRLVVYGPLSTLRDVFGDG